MLEGFGPYLRKLRNQKNLTLTQMGAQLGVDSGALSKIENNKRPLDDKLLPRISEIFDLDIEEVKEHYFSEKIAEILFRGNCPEEVLEMARAKLRYKKSQAAEQGSLEF